GEHAADDPDVEDVGEATDPGVGGQVGQRGGAAQDAALDILEAVDLGIGDDDVEQAHDQAAPEDGAGHVPEGVLRFDAQGTGALEPDEREDRQHRADEDAAGLDARQRKLLGIEDSTIMYPDVHAQYEYDGHRERLEDQRRPGGQADIEERDTRGKKRVEQEERDQDHS